MKFLVNLGELVLDLLHRLAGGLHVVVLTAVQPFQHPFGVLIRQGGVEQGTAHFLHHDFFPYEPLRARPPFLGTTEIRVPLLDFIRNHAAASATMEHSTIEVGFGVLGLRPAVTRQDFLHTIKKPLGYERFMPAIEDFAVKADETAINGVTQDTVVSTLGQNGTVCASQSGGVQFAFDVGDGIVVGGAEFKRPLHQGAAFGVNDHCLGHSVIEIAHGSEPWPDAVFHLLTLAAFDVLRQVIDVVFALTEHHAEHQFAGRCRFKGEGGETHMADDAGVHKVDESPAIKGVAGQSIGMPCQNSRRFTGFHAAKHLIEHGASGVFGRLLFSEYMDDLQPFAADEFPQFGLLVSNAPHLMRRVVG